MAKIKNNFGEKIQSLRKKKKQTVKDLQNFLFNNNYPITKKSIYQWERNETMPNIEVIKLLIKFFNTNPETLFNLDKKHISRIKNKKESEFIYSIRSNRKYKRLLIKFMNDSETDNISKNEEVM